MNVATTRKRKLLKYMPKGSVARVSGDRRVALQERRILITVDMILEYGQQTCSLSSHGDAGGVCRLRPYTKWPVGSTSVSKESARPLMHGKFFASCS